MNNSATAPSMVDRFFRLDPRSLGLFRLLFGLVLLSDLIHRWGWLRAFYSNQGVVPNHYHLFQLGKDQPIWSVYHAFSSVGEATTAFALTFVIYALFTVGYRTRIFHFLSLICLISLTGRNILLESPSNAVPTVILAVTLLLPLGSRWSIDSVSASMKNTLERDAKELNERAEPLAAHLPTLAAPITLLLIAFILLTSGLAQSGDSWLDGSALYYALHTDRWTGLLGLIERDALPAEALRSGSFAFRYAQFAAAILLIIPFARRLTRSLAALCMLFVGLTIGLLFTFGPYGWTLAAAAVLVLPPESWEARKKGPRPRTVIYDDSCGICGWLARLLKRLDQNENITFVGSSEPTTQTEDERITRLPDGITTELTSSSLVVVDDAGTLHTDALALSEILRSLPFLGLLGWIIRLPLFRQLVRKLYYVVAVRRTNISAACGLGACGIRANASPKTEDQNVEQTPAQRLGARLWIVSSSVLALLLAASVVVKAARNPINPALASLKLDGSAGDALAKAATIGRLGGNFALFAPAPPKKNSALVVDAKTRSDWRMDPLTGYAPNLELKDPDRARLGHLWLAYADAIRKPEYKAFRKEFRRYLNRGGWALNVPRTKKSKVRHYVTKLDVQWVSVPIAPPDGPASKGPIKERVIERDNVLQPKRNKPARRFRPGSMPGLRSIVK